MNKTQISLKETLSKKELEDVYRLENKCTEIDGTVLKLELEYKKMISKEKKENNSKDINEFMYYIEGKLVGYIGICNFGGSTIELNGMVHPDYRRRGIFTSLFNLVKEQPAVKDAGKVLLLTDSNSEPGKSFIKKVGSSYEHTEYELHLRAEAEKRETKSEIVLRKATNADAVEVARQNIIYFSDEQRVNEAENVESSISEDDIMLPEEEEKLGMLIYLAYLGEEVVGKINLQICDDVSGIFGLGVLPSQRKKGYGRQILIEGIKKIKEQNSSEIMLQVAAQNEKALNLYISCGFIRTSTMNYYRML